MHDKTSEIYEQQQQHTSVETSVKLDCLNFISF